MSRGSMNQGFDQRIADWLEDDPDDAPDIVLETVMAAFPSIPQRPAVRGPWRLPVMFINRAAAAVLSIVVLVAGAGFLLRGLGGSGPGGPPTSPSPALSPSTSATGLPSASRSPVPTAIPTLSPNGDGAIAPGMYRVAGFATPFTVTLPAGWILQGGFSINQFSIRNDTAFLALIVVRDVYKDPCHTEQAPTRVGPRVDDLVAALSSMTGFRVEGIREASVGGVPGKAFTLANSIDLQAAGCSNADVLWIGRDGDGAPIFETPGGADPVWAVDVSGTTVLIGGPASVVDAISFGEPGA